MNKLWAPWRAKYIARIRKKQKGCLFCRILTERKDKRNCIFIRRPHAFAVLNIYPYSNGHCLVLSNRHVNDIDKLKREELADMMDLLMETKRLLTRVLKPDGFNIGLNLGRSAGAGIPGHVHVHIVPRWKGDHNFMPVTGGARVLSQSLDVIYKLLAHAHTKRH
ncbi:MAG: HIT domain-containing protein [Candidatus Omnitrophota bacterium]|nr:HIT domain-containing protein [Candidatus Omnitrophota bacterium]